ncbi:MAG: D-alanyl-D-alanine carboxypeptidase [Eubacterium sp.]|nr:D-alanyl-D-alanine carboxypeptidase [Eubacterium sp.]
MNGERRIRFAGVLAVLMIVALVFFMMPAQSVHAAKKAKKTETEEQAETESKKETKKTKASKKTEEESEKDTKDTKKNTKKNKKKKQKTAAEIAAEKAAEKKRKEEEEAKRNPLGLAAGGAILYCDNIGETVYALDEEKHFNPYSVTKVMTCLLAVQHLALDEEVTISENAAAVGESTMDLQPGEVVTVEELLYGAMLMSGNDAAYALGEAVSGDMTKFIELMNQTAENIGCENTHFTSPNGLTESSEHYTSAYDMMQIIRVAFTNQALSKVAGAKTYKMRTTNKHAARTMRNHLSYVNDKNSGIYAAKTGYWSDTQCTLAAGYDKNGLQMFIVLLGDTKAGRQQDLEKLLAYAQDSVKGVRVIKEGKEVGKVRIRRGAVTKLKAYTAEEGYAYLPKEGAKSLISTSVSMKTDVTAPVKSGDVVGYFRISVGDDVVNEVPLVIHEDVEKGWILSYFGISNMMTILIGVIGAALILFLIWAAAARAKVKRKRRKARERQIQRLAQEQYRKERDRQERDWNF